jgi:two-component system sensor histidine kinase/response regulator
MISTNEFTTLLEEKELQKQPFHFIEYFPAAALLLNENLEVITINKYAQLFIGDSENIIGKKINELITGNNSEELIYLLRRSFTSFIPHTVETKIRMADNRYIEAISMFKSFTDPDTNQRLSVFAILDFTTQKMKQEIIKDSEFRFKNMANTAPVMIWIADVDGLFSFVNNVWLEYAGEELGNQLGMNWLNNVHPEDSNRLLTNYRASLKMKESFSIEFRFKDKNGNYNWMVIKGKPRFSQENIYMGFIGSCINIQDQKEIEAKILNLNKELRETITNRDKFFSIISHDLRSPLGGVMGILDILNSSYESLDETEIREIISDATLVSKTTYTLLENLLEWSRIQTGKIYYQPENLQIHRLVENISQLYAQNMKNKDIAFDNDTEPDHLIYADKAMTETILRNLVSNAIKFTNQSGLIKVSSRIENEMLLVQVKDSGVGMENENIAKLFKGEITISTKGTAKESGTGLGLIICKEFVEKQNGKIWSESQKNEGSTFYFSVPIAK